MPEQSEYLKPPVSEALIDIRIEPLSDEHLPVLENMHSHFIKEFPKKKVRHRFMGTVQVQGSQVVASPTVSGPIGYWFLSEDGRKIIQIRLDGFTFNRLKPDPSESWPGWPKLRQEALEAWDFYIQALKIDEITRIAVRYINTIVIPETTIELTDYFTAAPRIPQGLPYQELLNFMSTVAIKIPEHKAVAAVKYAPSQQQSSGAIAIALDIDVFRAERASLNSLRLWETLDEFRNVKNTIFESNLLPKAKRLFNT